MIDGGKHTSDGWGPRRQERIRRHGTVDPAAVHAYVRASAGLRRLCLGGTARRLRRLGRRPHSEDSRSTHAPRGGPLPTKGSHPAVLCCGSSERRSGENFSGWLLSQSFHTINVRLMSRLYPLLDALAFPHAPCIYIRFVRGRAAYRQPPSRNGARCDHLARRCRKSEHLRRQPVRPGQQGGRDIGRRGSAAYPARRVISKPRQPVSARNCVSAPTRKICGGPQRDRPTKKLTMNTTASCVPSLALPARSVRTRSARAQGVALSSRAATSKAAFRVAGASKVAASRVSGDSRSFSALGW